MSRETVAAFLHEAAINPLLRQELATLAANHGFVFGPEELGELDLENWVAASLGAPEPSAVPDIDEDEATDPGFGIIEVPA